MSTLTQESIRLDAWRSVFEKTNRILSEQKVTVTVVADGAVPHQMEEIPAWSDGLAIHLNGTKVREMLNVRDPLAAVLRLKGLNYHELCHVLYTPRMTDELPRRIVKKAEETGDRTWWYAFNALEDQRIETWFTAMYGASRRYFEATVLEWIIKEGNAEAAILLYGRKYLSPKVRVQVGRVFRKKYGKALYDEFKTVIDEYITLVLPTDSVKASQLITKYHELLSKMRQMNGANLPPLVINDNGMADGCPQKNSPDVPRAGRVYVKQVRVARDRAADMIDDAIDADLDEEAKQDAQKGAPEPKQPDQGQDSGQQGDEGQQAGQSQDDAGDQAGASQSGDQGDSSDQSTSAGDSSQAATDDGGQAAGDGAVEDHMAGDDKSLADEINDMVNDAHDGLDDVHDDEWVQQDVDNLLDAVKANEMNGRMNAEGKAANGPKMAPEERHNLAVRRVHTVLTRIRQEAEPETLRRMYHGRVDPRRIVSRQPHEVDIFKTWDHGNEEETGVEAVVLVDVSGSMNYVMTEASAAMWVLKRAFDKTDIRTTVLIYDTDHQVLYQPGEKASPVGIPNINSGGGTDPSSALTQAQRILTKSNAPNKVLVTVTDGQWQGNDDHYNKVLKSMHRIGVTSLLLGLNSARQRYGKHGHMEGHDIQTVGELAKVATKLVANIMRNANRA